MLIRPTSYWTRGGNSDFVITLSFYHLLARGSFAPCQRRRYKGRLFSAANEVFLRETISFTRPTTCFAERINCFSRATICSSKRTDVPLKEQVVFLAKTLCSYPSSSVLAAETVVPVKEHIFPLPETSVCGRGSAFDETEPRANTG